MMNTWVATSVRALCLAFLTLLAGQPAAAAIFNVSNANDINNAMALAQPGDTLIMTNGTWTNQNIDFAGIGTAGNPITLRPQTPGGVLLNGLSTLRISGDYLVVDGLHFKGGTIQNSDHVVQFRGPLGEATNSRFTNSVIESYNPADLTDKYHYVSLYGQNNRVDHSRFLDQQNIGPTVVAWLDETPAMTPAYHQIDNNHFGDRPLGWDNGFETIRLGDSDTSLVNAHITVENNLFERADGEIEIISSKSNNNIFRNNTFRDSKGTLTLRHGNANIVEGNFFLGGGTQDSGAIRVVGENHIITNNYIADVDDQADGAISFAAGVPNSPLNGYAQVKNVTVAHNTIVNVAGAAITYDWGIGSSGRSLLPQNLTIAGNLLSNAGTTIFEGSEGVGFVYADNIAFGSPLGIAPKPGITVVNPQLVQDANGIWRPAPGSPAIDGAAAAFVTDDMDGQTRVGLFDIGADELSGAPILRMPLTTDDVGASWHTYVPPTEWGGPPPLPPGAFIVIQAEDYAAITDPDNDGVVWTVAQVAGASGGKVIKAPTGSVTNLSTGPHETLAHYDAVFSESGQYTAYYLARGFSSSTDSFFVPTAFGVDPTSTDNISSNSAFRWETGGKFTVSQAMVGQTLEFRIGRREGLAEIDAILFHINGSLTPIQLDAILASSLVIAGDLDGDGFVGIADLNIVLGNWNQAVPPGNPLADPSGDGFVGIEDLNMVLGNWNAGTPPGAHATDTLPEPGSLCLLVMMVPYLCARTRCR